MSALPRRLVAPISGFPRIKDEIPRTVGYPGFYKLPHYPERDRGATPRYMPLPDIADFPLDFPSRTGEGGTYEECQRNRDPNVEYLMDPCQGRPHGGVKLPDLDSMPSFPG